MKRVQSAGGVVVGLDGKILVVSQQGMSWSLPKGHVDSGESTMEAARREIFEESGVSDLCFIADLGSYERYKIGLLGKGDDTSEKKFIHMFLFTTQTSRLSPRDPDNPEARWVEAQDVVNILTHAKDKEFFESVRDEIPKIIASGRRVSREDAGRSRPMS